MVLKNKMVVRIKGLAADTKSQSKNQHSSSFQVTRDVAVSDKMFLHSIKVK